MQTVNFPLINAPFLVIIMSWQRENAMSKEKIGDEMTLEEIEAEGREMLQGISRREFLSRSIYGACGLAAASLGLSKLGVEKALAASGGATVVQVLSSRAVAPGPLYNAPVVHKMVDKAVITLTGKDTAGAAWASLFSKDDTVGIKVSCIAGANCSTRPELVERIIGGLKFAGVKENNIIIFERHDRELVRAGFPVNKGKTGVRSYGRRYPGYESQPVKLPNPEYEIYLSKVVTQEITALINVPILKTHIASGITCALKNHLGSIRNPAAIHRARNDMEGIGDLNAAAPLREKTRLIVCDALRPLYNKGPQDNPRYRWLYQGILASFDPVAMDVIGKEIIEAKRKEELGDEWPIRLGREAYHIKRAAKVGVGQGDRAKINLVNVNL